MQSPLKTTPLVLEIPVVAMAALEKAAATKGFKTKQYAQMIFEAAFSARVGIDRNQTPLDRELDEQVRLVFAHAGQGTAAAIGRAIGIPAERVERILAGWQHTARQSDVTDTVSPAVVDQRASAPTGSASDEIPATIPEAKASEDNGATALGNDEVPADSVTGDASRPSVGGGSDDADAPAPAKAECASAPIEAHVSKAKPVEHQKLATVTYKTAHLPDLTTRQLAVFVDIARRAETSETMHADEIARATGLKPADVSSALKTLMGRALISRAAGRFTLTTRGTAMAASLSDRAA